ncbi:hypothetical protein JTE90_020227 [Oedothorax gibbosus]|uniref:Uncharacterized protein n=1 Tax=Oedothorax gibbosus TaxID=931172 RepID=A0AAV6V022_9ARAC|nr:hypothetical protein JTE90_020227 [Oedothorax gibbosus]
MKLIPHKNVTVHDKLPSTRYTTKLPFRFRNVNKFLKKVPQKKDTKGGYPNCFLDRVQAHIVPRHRVDPERTEK